MGRLFIQSKRFQSAWSIFSPTLIKFLVVGSTNVYEIRYQSHIVEHMGGCVHRRSTRFVADKREHVGSDSEATVVNVVATAKQWIPSGDCKERDQVL